MPAEHQTRLHRKHAITLTQGDFDRFADISGDHNPIHVDAAWAKATPFGATVSHGMLLFSHLRALMERACPGARLQRQELMFQAPAYAGEALHLVLDGIHDGAGGAIMHTRIHKPDGRLAVDGSARLVAAGAEADVPAAAAEPTADSPNLRTMPDLPGFAALNVGTRAEVRRACTGADITAWTHLVGMPIPPATVPEPLIAALYSYLLGEQVPGHGTNYLKQSLYFHALAEVGEPLCASVQITRLRADKALVNLDTQCHDAGGRLVCSGQALVLFRR